MRHKKGLNMRYEGMIDEERFYMDLDRYTTVHEGEMYDFEEGEAPEWAKEFASLTPDEAA